MLIFCTFTCSVTLHLFSQALCSGMCTSAVSDESVVNRVLICACVCVFKSYMPACSLPTGTGDREYLQEKKIQYWEFSPQNCRWVIPSGSGSNLKKNRGLQSGRLLSGFKPTKIWCNKFSVEPDSAPWESLKKNKATVSRKKYCGIQI